MYKLRRKILLPNSASFVAGMTQSHTLNNAALR